MRLITLLVALLFAGLAHAEGDLRRGAELQMAGKLMEAIDAYAKAIAAGENVPTASYNTATAYALLGKPDEAFRWLEKAGAAGFPYPDVMGKDPDLAALRGDKRWKAVYTGVHKNAFPCQYAKEARAFDFYLGKWDVVPDGGQRKMATVEVVPMSGGCAMMHTWTGNSGSEGRTFIGWDGATNRWHMLSVGQGGDALVFSAEIVGGEFRLEGENVDLRQKKKIRERARIFAQPDKSVREIWEESHDGGKTWKPHFSGTLMPAK